MIKESLEIIEVDSEKIGESSKKIDVDFEKVGEISENIEYNSEIIKNSSEIIEVNSKKNEISSEKVIKKLNDDVVFEEKVPFKIKKLLPSRLSASNSIDLLDTIFVKQDLLLADKYKSEQEKATEKQLIELQKRKMNPSWQNTITSVKKQLPKLSKLLFFFFK